MHIVVDVDCSSLEYDNVLVGRLLHLENNLNFLVGKCQFCVPDRLFQVIGCVLFVVVV